MLEDIGATIQAERSTTKEPLEDDDVRALLETAERIVIARGRSRRCFDPSEVELDDLKGPSGKYRAPMLLTHDTLLVGFSADALAEFGGRERS